MKRATLRDPAQRLRRMHDRLAIAYGPQYWWPAETAFEVVIGAYLTQNTSWKSVTLALRNLRDAGALTVAGLRGVSQVDLQALIRPSGFFTRKAPALKAFVAMLDAEFEGSLELMAKSPTSTLRRRLLELPGVGPETADAILLYALGHPVPVADEYLRRIAERHRLFSLAPGRDRKGYEALVELTMHAFSEDPSQNSIQLLKEFHALTIAVGKAHCGKTQNCSGCPLAFDLKEAGGSEVRKRNRFSGSVRIATH